MTNTYEAVVLLAPGSYQTVTVEASSYYRAKQLLERLYGAGKVMNLHQR